MVYTHSPDTFLLGTRIVVKMVQDAPRGAKCGKKEASWFESPEPEEQHSGEASCIPPTQKRKAAQTQNPQSPT